MSSSYSSPLPPCVTPGWNDPPDLTRSANRPSSNRLMSRHRRPVDPSIQSSAFDSNSFNHTQNNLQQSSQYHQTSFGSSYASAPHLDTQRYQQNQQQFANHNTPPLTNNCQYQQGIGQQQQNLGTPLSHVHSSSFSGSITPETLSNSAFQPYQAYQQQQEMLPKLKSVDDDRNKNEFVSKNPDDSYTSDSNIYTPVHRIDNNKGTETVIPSNAPPPMNVPLNQQFNHFLIQDRTKPTLPSSNLGYGVQGTPSLQQQQQPQGAFMGHPTLYHPTNEAIQQVENLSNYLIFSPPHAVMSEERRPITQPDPATYIPPKKAAGDVSLSGNQLVAFLTKATLRLPAGETCKGIQLRIENFNQMIQNDSISEACLKKLNFVVDAIDRDMLEDANVFFDQLMLTFSNETGHWGHGVKLLINELKRIKNDSRIRSAPERKEK
uniref:SRA1 domain-containing protein n=1 Tax=Parastrongyloides trichosuri TaxID=131310 RepID=A0A0N4ZPM9_PARTI